MEGLAEIFEVVQIVIGLFAPLLIPFWLFVWRKRTVILWFIAYVGIYVVLSLNGRYVPYIGGASDGSVEWYAWRTDNRRPSKGGRIKSGPSPLGFFFLLPAKLDADYWHPTIAGDDPRAQKYWMQD